MPSRRIDAGYGKTFLGNPARQQSRAAAKVEDMRAAFQRPRQAEVEVVADIPAVEVVVERGEEGILEHLIGRHYRTTILGAARGPRWLAVSCFHTRPAMFL
jgi:hypothetical protein